MKITAFSAALDRAGFDRALFDLRAIAENFIKSGGTRDAWMRAFDVAAGMLGEDHLPIFRQDQTSRVPVQQPNASEEANSSVPAGATTHLPPARNPMLDEGHAISAHESPTSAAPIRQPDRSEGHTEDVQQDHRIGAPTPTPITSGKAVGKSPVRAGHTMPPAREPSRGFINATIAANQTAARSVLHTVKTSDGRWWAEVCPYEVNAMQRDAIRGMALLSACGALNDRQSRMTFGELLSPERAKLALDQAQKELGHVA